MIPEERMSKIRDLLRRKKTANLEEIMSCVYASKSTVRRDLIDMEKAGFLRRIKGGAMLVSSDTQEYFDLVRSNENKMEKQSIARRADQFLHDDMSLFMDSSTTAFYLTHYLVQYKNVVVITNSVKVAMSMIHHDEIKVFCSGGEMQKHSFSVLGPSCQQFLSAFHPELAFFSCKGADSRGAYEVDIGQVSVKQVMIQNARKPICLVDHTKFDTRAFVELAAFTDLAAVITDCKPKGLAHMTREEREKFIW